MLCAKCSAEQRIEDIYCPSCGALIELPEGDQPQSSAGLEETNTGSGNYTGDTVESLFLSGPIWLKVVVLVVLVIIAIII
ncbi:MAG: hypothetical protein GY753_10840 [Gammaproteobacteria bacterium]|nr:hypothetical protein [Gammaproteobacteria bacterium]